MSGVCGRCSKPIEPCDCGGTACTGWGHLPPAARHWCGTKPQDGQPKPAEAGQ